MRIRTLCITVLFIVLGLSATSDCFAAIYKYIDKDGMIYFADDLQSIPVQYRAVAKIVSGEATKEEKGPTNQHQQTVQTETKKNETMSAGAQDKPFVEIAGKSSFGSRALLSAIIVVSALFSFGILGILDRDHTKAYKIVRVVILWGVSVFLLYAHARDVVAVFGSLGNKIENTRHESEEKGKKAAKALNAFSTLVEQAEKASPAHPAGAEPDKKE